MLRFSLTLAAIGTVMLVAGRLPALAAWRHRFLGREPYAHPGPTIALAILGPVYMVINTNTSGRTVYVPELPLDRAIPLEPAWIVVYGSMYVFAFLPVFVVRDPELRCRAVLAYIMVQLVSYVGFLTYPTIGPRPEQVPSQGFLAWTLQVNYEFDPPYNCFPSLHVAYACLAALTAYRVHRALGLVALGYAGLIGASTLFTKQHYLLDVIGGGVAAGAAYLLFLRGHRRAALSETDRRRAPMRALGALGVFGIMALVFWTAYLRARPGGAAP